MLKSAATISNGEIIVPGVAIDVRVLDNLCAAFAIQANTPNNMLCMTGSKAMVTNSSYTLNITDTSFNIDTNLDGMTPTPGGSGHAFNVTIPLTIDGTTLARILAESQWSQNAVFVRNLDTA